MSSILYQNFFTPNNTQIFNVMGRLPSCGDTSRNIAYLMRCAETQDHSREHLSKISYPEFYQQSGRLRSAIFNSNQTYHRSFKAFSVYISTIKLTEVCFVRHLKLMEYL